MEVFFIKPFKDLNEQLSILHSRGLKINDYKKAKQYLLTNNYYNVINGYSKFFTLPGTDTYKSGSQFNEVVSLYEFDLQITSIFLDSIILAENHIKYVTAYKFAEKYKDSGKYPFLDINNYKNKTENFYASNVILNFTKIITNNTSKYSPDNAIKHYSTKHNDIPIWVIIEFLTFGELQRFIRNLPDSLQNSIARSMNSFISDSMTVKNSFTPEMMISYMENIRLTRNVCAHGGRLFDFSAKQNCKYFIDLHEPLGISNKDDRKSLYSVFQTLKCFLSRVEFARLNNTLRKRLRTLKNRLKSTSINDIEIAMGFPIDWHLEDSLPQ